MMKRMISGLIAALLAAGGVSAQVAVTASDSYAATNQTSAYTNSAFTVTGDSNAVVALVSYESNEGGIVTLSATYGGIPMNQVSSVKTGANSQFASVFYLLDVTSGQELIVTPDTPAASLRFTVSAMALSGVTGVVDTATATGDSSVSQLHLAYNGSAGGLAVAAYVDNSFDGNIPSLVSGNLDTVLQATAGNFAGGSSGTLQAYGAIAVPGPSDDVIAQASGSSREAGVLVAFGGDVDNLITGFSPANNTELVPANEDIVVTANNALVSLYDHHEMLLIENGVTNDVSGSVVVGFPSGSMSFSYTNDLAYDAMYEVQFNVYRTDGPTNSINFTFTTRPEHYVLMSGIIQDGDDQSTIDFLTNRFQNVNVLYDNYSDIVTYSNLIAGADVFVVGRRAYSPDFANVTNSAAFNALTTPIVCFNGYVARSDSSRWGWFNGPATGGWSVSGDETTVTSDGASLFGVAAGTYDWFTAPAGNNYYGTGFGDVGSGNLLATLGGDILAAGWDAGDTSGLGEVFGGKRLFLGLAQSYSDGPTIMPVGAGEVALIKAVAAYTPLVPRDEFLATTSPADGAADVAVDTDITVTITDIMTNFSGLVSSYQMTINSNVVSASKSSANGITTFTYDPATDLAYDTTYAVQLQVIRTDGETNTVNFSFTTIQNYILDILVSGTNQGRDQGIIDFLHSNFQGPLKITYGDYSNIGNTNIAAQINAADLFMVGRSFSSSAYDNVTNSAAFNALNKPAVAFSSYLVRNVGNRWGWHSGSEVGTNSVAGTETLVTAAGAGIFGVATGAYDWYMGTDPLNAAGSGTVGSGAILATIGSNNDIISAHWSAGDTTALGETLGGDRLLFNLGQTSAGITILPEGDGAQALIKALEAYTPLQAKPTIAPHIAISFTDPDSVSLWWPSENGVNYTVQSRLSLGSGSWQTKLSVTGNGSTIMTNVATGAAAEFYRLEVQ